MPITKDQARDLSRAFYDASHALGEYRYNNWVALGVNGRKQVEDIQWTLWNYSSDLTTLAVGIALLNMQGDLKAVMDGTAKATAAVAKIQALKDVLSVATAIVVLGGAIVSQNPGAIAKAAPDLLKTVKDAGGKKKPKKDE